MSVLVKRMMMPNACADCPLNYDMMACSVTGTQWWSDRFVILDFDEHNERLPDCPLVELPEKHGDLIDRDACVEYVQQNDTHAWEALAYAETVIEAEGVDE